MFVSLLPDLDGCTLMGPLVDNSGCVCAHINAAVTDWSAEVIVPGGRVNVDMLKDAHVPFNTRNIIVSGIIFSIIPGIGHDWDFFHDGSFSCGGAVARFAS